MDIMKLLETLSTGDMALFAILILSLIQVAPLKIDPWTKLFQWAGKTINHQVLDELGVIKKDLTGVHEELDEMKKEAEVREANAARNRILRFDDELRRKIEHSEEFWDQTLDDVSFYRQFCDDNKKYPNSKADAAMQNIEEIYHECKKEDKFI